MAIKISKIKVGYVIKVDSYKVKQYEGKRVVDEVQVLEVPSSRSKFVLVESPELMANVLVPLSDCNSILNHAVTCEECGTSEEMGADEPRDHFTEFTSLKLNNDGTALYRCNQCGKECSSEIFNKEDL